MITIIATLIGTNFTNKVKAQVDVGDSLALVALYNSTDGSNWTNNTNWLSGNADTWFGVTVTGNRVFNLNLFGNNLSGVIPPEVGNLTNLATLYLNENQLTGNIPTELGNLNNLADLSLYDNQLSGTIPVEFGNLSNLISLRLQNNSLNGSIPVELGNLINLQFLWLNANQLTGAIPAEVGNLTNLLQLYLSFNQLTGAIPLEFGNLTNLQFLDLVVNQLTGTIPVEFGNLTNIQQLGLSSNQLIGALPVEMRNLTNLQGLWLSSNQLTGSVPLEFVNLTLSYFFFENTSLCEPDNPAYSTWKATVTSYTGTNVVCPPVASDPPKPQMVEVISPNGDGINDEATITNIEFYPDHRVLIYDVLGRLVYETSQYDNINNPFVGVGNVNGYGELPAGTYYYLVDVGETKKNGTGFFVMKRR